MNIICPGRADDGAGGSVGIYDLLSVCIIRIRILLTGNDSAHAVRIEDEAVLAEVVGDMCNEPGRVIRILGHRIHSNL